MSQKYQILLFLNSPEKIQVNRYPNRRKRARITAFFFGALVRDFNLPHQEILLAHQRIICQRTKKSGCAPTALRCYFYPAPRAHQHFLNSAPIMHHYICRRQSSIWYFCLKAHLNIFIGAFKGRKNQHVRAWNGKLNGKLSIIQNGKAQTQKLKNCTPGNLGSNENSLMRFWCTQWKFVKNVWCAESNLSVGSVFH